MHEFLFRHLVLLLAVGLVSGCATTGRSGGWSDGWWVRQVRVEGPETTWSLSVRYRTGDLGRGWARGAAPPGDYAFYNRSRGATVYADTSCGKRYEDTSLRVLLNHLTMGFEDVVNEDESDLMLSDRAALERVGSGSLDGVPIRLASTVIKKGPCVFDLILISAPSSFERTLEDYRRFRDGFEARIGR